MPWIQITSGRGPDECSRAVYRISRRIMQEAEALGFEAEIIEEKPGKKPETCESIVLDLHGDNANSFAEDLSGSMLWICRSPFRPNHSRKNWFVGVSVIDEPVKSSFDMKYIKIETMCSSGPGGQHVNKTESAVRAIHVPTGITAVSQDQRSQLRNKELALKRLFHKLTEIENSQEKASRKKRWDEHNALERGNPVRVYRGEQFIPEFV